MTRNEQISGLRELVAFLEANPEFPFPCNTFNIFVGHGEGSPKEEMASLARMMAPCEKDTLGNDWFVIRRSFGAVTLEVNAMRHQVCTRKVVRVEHVPEYTVPEKVVPAHDVEEFEWECPSILAATSNLGQGDE